MGIEKLLDEARKCRAEMAGTESARREEKRSLWAERLSGVLNWETWSALGVDPYTAEIEHHNHINAYQSLGEVVEKRGMVRHEGEKLVGITFLMPLTEPARAEVRLSVAPVHGTFWCTLWGPSGCGVFEERGEIVSVTATDEKLAEQQSDNARILGDLLLRFLEFRDEQREKLANEENEKGEIR